jgi:hypothetical protein
MQRAAFVFVLASVLAPQLAADARFQPEPPFTLAHGGEWYDDSQVASDATGGYIVAWIDNSAETILAQHFDARGAPRGDPFIVQVLTAPNTYIGGAVLAVAGDGRFVVAYTQGRYWPDTAGLVGFCLFGADDTRLLCEGLPTEEVDRVTAAFGPTGIFMLGWGEYDATSDFRMLGRIYDRDGSPRGPVFVIDAGATYAYGPFVTHAGCDAFRAAWEDYDVVAGSHAHIRRYDAWGAPLDQPLEVNALPACADLGGNFVSVWIGRDEQETWATFARLYDVTGQARSAMLKVNQATYDATGVAAACDDAGNFVVAWAAPSAPLRHTFARRYVASGAPDSPEFRVDNGSECTTLSGVVSARDGNFTVMFPSWSCGAPYVAQPYRVQPPPRAKGDFDGDGHADLVLRRFDDGSVRVWGLHEGVRTANLPLWPTSPDPDWQIDGAADFNADGHADLLLRQPLTGDVRVWLLGGASGVEVVGQAMITGIPLPRGSWEIAATADFDRDGRADLLWRDGATQRLMVWLLDGTTWRATLVPDPDRAVDTNWMVVAAGDMNGDGWADLLWYNTSSGRVVQWLLDAGLTRITGRFTDPMQAGDANWQVAAAGDYGFGVRAQAGTYDLLWRNTTTGKLVVWFMDNAGKRTAGTFLTPSAPSDPLAWTVVGPR